MSQSKDHLSVCICTFQRPRMLGHLLETLETQETQGLFDYSIAVVDNDRRESARETVEKARQTSRLPIHYDVVPEQNISLARNRALRLAEADFLAGIDDDEFPDGRWLLRLHRAIKTYGADGVLGPVLPSFEKAPPSWALRGGLYERKAHPSGTVFRNPSDMRCGNFLLSGRIVRDNGDLFDPAFGKTGGEDIDFFKRMMERGYTFVWCQEARVFETVPPARLKRSYLFRRALLRGVVAADRDPLFSLDTMKSVIAFSSYTLALPMLLLYGNGLFMRYAIKNGDHIAKILARCGIRLVTERAENGPAASPQASSVLGKHPGLGNGKA